MQNILISSPEVYTPRTTNAINEIYRSLESPEHHPECKPCFRPAKRLKFDDEDNQKLEKLKNQRISPEPEPVSPGKVENQRKLEFKTTPEKVEPLSKMVKNTF